MACSLSTGPAFKMQFVYVQGGFTRWSLKEPVDVGPQFISRIPQFAFKFSDVGHKSKEVASDQVQVTKRTLTGPKPSGNGNEPNMSCG